MTQVTLRGGWAFNMKKPWMSDGERKTFKAMRDAGQITIFRTATCEAPECNGEVPKGKRFCSVKCMDVVEGRQDGHEQIDDDDWEDG
jgi:hypothetical protein